MKHYLSILIIIVIKGRIVNFDHEVYITALQQNWRHIFVVLGVRSRHVVIPFVEDQELNAVGGVGHEKDEHKDSTDPPTSALMYLFAFKLNTHRHAKLIKLF